MAGLDKALYNFIRRRQIPGLATGAVYADSQGILSAFDVGKTYFVAGNYGLDTNDGSSWQKAFKTLAAAISANNTNIAAGSHGWAARNKIYISGDTFAEDLVAFPNKCDVIGVGSYDANDQPGISGHHAPVNTGNYGTRFFNVHFKAKAVASAVVTLVNSSSGIQFIGCTGDATLGTVTSFVLATASPFLKVIGCDFRGGFATSYISCGAGEAGGARIIGNDMTGSLGKGVVLASDTTTSWPAVMRENFVQSAGQWVDDDADLLYIVGNDGITAIDCATYTAGFDANLLRMARNTQTGSNAGDHDSVPHMLFA